MGADESDYIVITNDFTGEKWAVIRSGDNLRLFAPMHWDPPYRSLGLRYYPGSGIDLPSNPRKALRKARRHVRGVAKGQRRAAKKVERAKSAMEEARR